MASRSYNDMMQVYVCMYNLLCHSDWSQTKNYALIHGFIVHNSVFCFCNNVLQLALAHTHMNTHMHVT